jgi:hypothetical protein
MRSGQPTTASFPLSTDELHLILEHRLSTQSLVPTRTVVMEDRPEPTQDVPAEPEVTRHAAAITPEESPPTSLIGAAVAAHVASDPAHAGPPDDDFAAAARWLALATRDDTEPYRPTLGGRHS